MNYTIDKRNNSGEKHLFKKMFYSRKMQSHDDFILTYNDADSITIAIMMDEILFRWQTNIEQKDMEGFPLSGRVQNLHPRVVAHAGQTIKKSPPLFSGWDFFFKTAVTYSPTCAVPSARPGLTSLFGMGRGGTPVL